MSFDKKFQLFIDKNVFLPSSSNEKVNEKTQEEDDISIFSEENTQVEGLFEGNNFLMQQLENEYEELESLYNASKKVKNVVGNVGDFLSSYLNKISGEEVENSIEVEENEEITQAQTIEAVPENPFEISEYTSQPAMKGNDLSKYDTADWEDVAAWCQASENGKLVSFCEVGGLKIYDNGEVKVNKKTGEVVILNAENIQVVSNGKSDNINLIIENSTISVLDLGDIENTVKINNTIVETYIKTNDNGSIIASDSKINERVINDTQKVAEAILDENIAQILSKLGINKTNLTPEEQIQIMALGELNENLSETKKLLSAQDDKDGIVRKGYNFVKELLDNPASRKDVENAIQEQENIINELKAAFLKGDDAFRAKYKELLGVEYSEEAIQEYIITKNMFDIATAKVLRAESFIQEIENIQRNKEINATTKKELLFQLYIDYYGDEEIAKEKFIHQINSASMKINSDRQTQITELDFQTGKVIVSEFQMDNYDDDPTWQFVLVEGIELPDDGERSFLGLSSYLYSEHNTMPIAEAKSDILGSSYDKIQNDYVTSQKNALGKSIGLQKVMEQYAQSQDGFIDKLSTGCQIAGTGLMVVGGIVCFIPGGQGIGICTMKAGQWVATGGMFLDNVLEGIDGKTSKDGLSKEEKYALIKETFIEFALLTSGRAIGKYSSALGDMVRARGGLQNVFLGYVKEIGVDASLSLLTDLIITGEIDLTGEGKNQILGLLTSVAGAKVSKMNGDFETAKKYYDNGSDVEARNYLTSKGYTNTEINKFFTTYKAEFTRLSEKDILKKYFRNDESYAENAKQLSLLCDSDFKKARKLLNNGYDAKKLYDVLSDCSPALQTKILDTLALGNVSIENVKNIATLGNGEYNQVIKLLNIGVDEYSARNIAMLEGYDSEVAIDLISKGIDGFDAYNIALLEGKEYNKAIDLINKGVNGKDAYNIATLDDCAYKIAMENINNGVDPQNAYKANENEVLKLTSQGVNEWAAERISLMDYPSYNKAMKLFNDYFVDGTTAYYIAKLDDIKYRRVLTLVSNGVDGNSAYNIALLDSVKYNKAVELINKGVDGTSSLVIAKFDRAEYDKALELINKGFDGATASNIIKLGEYNRAIHLINRGFNGAIANNIIKLSVPEYHKAMKFKEAGIPDTCIYNLAKYGMDFEAYSPKQLEIIKGMNQTEIYALNLVLENKSGYGLSAASIPNINKYYDKFNFALYGEPVDTKLTQCLNEIGNKYGITIKSQNNIGMMNNKNASFMLDENYLKAVDDALAEMQAQGLEIPEEIYIADIQKSGASGVFSGDNQHAITLNVTESDPKWIEAVVYHETAHMRDCHKSNTTGLYLSDENIKKGGITVTTKKGENYKGEMIDKIDTIEFNGKKITADEISGLIRGYATTNIHEFTAEVESLILCEAIVLNEKGEYNIKKENIPNTEFCEQWNSSKTEDLNNIMELYNYLTTPIS